MKNEKLGQEHAFPTDRTDGRGMWSKENTGMSKRFYAATQILSSIVVNEKLRLNWKGVIQDDYKEFNKMLVSQSYELADELLRQENHE